MTKGSDLLVAALENEGVERIFGIPGEENLDVVESLRHSKIELVITRHEQAAGFMAATYGRLTGKPGVCITTLGPGALNLTTGAAFAYVGAMPMMMITGQKGIFTSRQARFQIVDIVGAMKPLTKMARQIVSTGTIPTLVREAFRVAQEERPGPGAARAAGRHRRRGMRSRADDCAASARAADRQPGDARSRRRNDPRGEAAVDHARRRGVAAARHQRPGAVRLAHAHPLLHHADGQGHGARRHRALHGHRRALGARLRARRHRAGRPDRRHRPRHEREAAVPDGRRPAAGDPRRAINRRRSSRSTFRRPRWWATSAARSRCWPIASKARCRTPARCCRCAKASSRTWPSATPKTAGRRSASSTTCAR